MKILLACVVGVAVCGFILISGPEPLELSEPQGRPQVTIEPLQRQLMPRAVKAFGQLTPRQSLELTTQVAGEVTWVSEHLEAGQRVDQGDVLLRLDDRDYQIALASAEARFAQAQANIELEEGRAEIAQLEWTAWQETNDEDLPPNPLALRAPQRAEALAQSQAIAAAIDRAKLDIERTSIRAPWSATVVDSDAIAGRLLSVGEVTALLFPLDYAIIEVQVPVQTAQVFEAGIANIELRPAHDLGAAPVSGRLEGMIKSLSEETRLATLRVRIDDPLTHAGWVYGMHLEVRLVATQRQPVALIPADLIVSGNLIWLHRDGRAHRHQLSPVEVQGPLVAVEDNFKVGDTLIVERPIGLFDGAPVTAAEAVQ
ncbi:MAG: efflux RND transporter periplasmic adaptor subunit [Pseudomonadota bacterium]